MSINELHKQDFNARLGISETYTTLLMKALEHKKHFKIIRRADMAEEHLGIDWWVKFPNESKEQPIQFKLRDKRKDLPVVRFQPFWGLDHERTVVGRDFRGLRDKQSAFYYVAIRNESKKFSSIYRCTSDKLNSMIVELDQEWETVSLNETSRPRDMFGGAYPKSYFVNENVQRWLDQRINNKLVFKSPTNKAEIWWKKNYNEGSPKLNMYIPHAARETTFPLNDAESEQIERLFVKIRGGAVNSVE